MTINEFNLLSFDGKASLLTKYGRYLDERSSGEGARILIYDLFGFYVEVSYRFDKKVQYIRAVNNIFESESYLESINLLHLN
jgi:hypothetical protein